MNNQLGGSRARLWRRKEMTLLPLDNQNLSQCPRDSDWPNNVGSKFSMEIGNELIDDNSSV